MRYARMFVMYTIQARVRIVNYILSWTRRKRISAFHHISSSHLYLLSFYWLLCCCFENTEKLSLSLLSLHKNGIKLCYIHVLQKRFAVVSENYQIHFLIVCVWLWFHHFKGFIVVVQLHITCGHGTNEIISLFFISEASKPFAIVNIFNFANESPCLIFWNS